MSSGRILLLAQDSDYRHSLSFLLEAEGYEVRAEAMLPPPSAGAQDCVVLDHRVLRPVSAEAALAFCRRSAPVILLGSRAPLWFDLSVGRHVETPIVENRLVITIRDAIAAAHRPRQ